MDDSIISKACWSVFTEVVTYWTRDF